jgi:hypothetical protein
MPIKTTCPGCDRAHTVADEQEGRKVVCKGCAEPFTVRREAAPAAKKGGVPVWVWLLLGGGLFGGFLLVVVGVVVALFVFSGPRLTVANVQQIKGGMSEGEVVSLLGRPTESKDGLPAEFDQGATQFNKNIGGVDVNFRFGPMTPGLRTLTWRKGNDFVTVVLRNGKVASVYGYLKEGGRFGAR